MIGVLRYLHKEAKSLMMHYPLIFYLNLLDSYTCWRGGVGTPNQNIGLFERDKRNGGVTTH